MEASKPTALLIHVEDIQAGLDWYQKVFPSAKALYLSDSDFIILDINGFLLEIVQADEKVSAGKSGTVLYWSVSSLVAAIEHFEQLEAKLYRGPMKIEAGMGMCQIEDPFGNLIGLRGSYEN